MNEGSSTAQEVIIKRVPAKRPDRSNNTRNGLLCALAVAVAVLVVYPIANMPFVDDFSYTKTAYEFARTGHFVYNGWATAMLGWQIPWGALFIKIFGYSFNVVRFSMLPIAMATVYLFHQILSRFGINPRNAVFGALTIGLSPLFLPFASSYMTDVPGLFVILLCIAMCQRAAAAHTNRAALLWLLFATLVNVAGGTVRQIAWLGALVMVPSTAWLLRKRRGMKVVGVLMWVLSLIGVLVCLHWFNRQPYSVPEHIIWGPFHARMLLHLGAQLVKALLCLLLVTLPVLVAWLPLARHLRINTCFRLVGAIAVYAVFVTALHLRGDLTPWVMPWLTFFLIQELPVLPNVFGMTAATLNFLMAMGISLLVLASGITLVETLASLKKLKREKLTPDGLHVQAERWNELAWILGPFFFSYLLLLFPRGTYSIIQDKYLLGIAPIAVIVVLKLYQERIGTRLSVFSLITLAVFTVCAVGGSHDIFTDSRALVCTIDMLRASGVPRVSILTISTGPGMASEGWAQIETGGHINSPRIQVPAGAYNPNVPDREIPDGCPSWFTKHTPALIPKYFIVSTPTPDCGPTTYPPIRYRAWLPPFHRAYYAGRIRSAK